MRSAVVVLAVFAACKEPARREVRLASPDVKAGDARVDDAVVDARDVVSRSPVVSHPGSLFVIAHGLQRLGERGQLTTLDSFSPFDSDVIADREGNVWYHHGNAHDERDGSDLNAYLGGTRHVLRVPDEIYALAPAARDGVWLVGDKRLLRITSQLAEEPRALPHTSEGVPLTSRALIDTGDSLWLGTVEGLWRSRDRGASWQLVRGGRDIAQLARDREGVVWMADDAHRRVIGIDGDRTIEISYPADFTTVDELRAGPDNLVYALVSSPRHARPHAQLDGQHLAAFDRAGWIAPLGSHRDLSPPFVVDGAGRLWVGHDAGLVVLDAAGATILAIPVATIPGLTDEVRAMTVVDDGPAVLPTPRPPPHASVRGRLLHHGGQPAIGGRFDVCVGDCRNDPQFAVQTDGLGRFATDGVVIAQYETLGTQHSTEYVTSGLHFLKRGSTELWCCLQAQPGQMLDLGDVTLPAGE